jgi:MFS transporter, DHA2 family, multidrug resistance protein
LEHADANADVALYPVKRRGLLVAAVMGASMIQFLDSTIANVAIPHMQTSLSASLDTISWVLTSYIVASVIAMPMSGWLADRVGSRRLFLIAVTGFIISSMLCGIATGLFEMVVYRMLQGICGAFIGTMSQSILFDITAPSGQARAMAIWGMTVMIGPISGPVIGGWLTDTLSWRWCFYVNVPIGIPTLAILWWLLPSRPVVRRHFDLFGFSMLALGLATLQLMLDRGQQQDWFESWEIRIEALVALSAFWIFAVQLFTAKSPLFDRSFLRNSNFMIGMAFQVIMGMMMVGLSALMPPMLQSLFGYSVIDTGLLLAPRGVGVLIGMVVATRLATKVDVRIFVLVGFSITVWTLWQMTQWSLTMDSTPFAITGFIQGLGMGMTFMPLNLMAFSTVPPQFRTDGSSLLNLSRSMGASAGIAVIVALLSRNIQTSHADIAGNVTSMTLPAVDPSSLDRFGAAGETAMAILNGEITRQAAMIAYLDDFQVMMYGVLLFMPLTLLLRPAKPQKGAEAPVME